MDGVERIQKGALGVHLDQQRFLGKVVVLMEATPMDVFQEMVNFITHLHMDEILKIKNSYPLSYIYFAILKIGSI